MGATDRRSDEDHGSAEPRASHDAHAHGRRRQGSRDIHRDTFRERSSTRSSLRHIGTLSARGNVAPALMPNAPARKDREVHGHQPARALGSQNLVLALLGRYTGGMIRGTLSALLVLCACASSSSNTSDGATCPDLSGSWSVTKHCDASLVGMTAHVTQTACSLAFAPPFDGFTGRVTPLSKVTLSGPQSCMGTAAVGSISLRCTPGTCAVTLTR
jgi:hypothetical protein